VLDIGCGGGILSESMAGLGAHVKGIDLSSEALGVADLHSLESGVTVRLRRNRRGSARGARAGYLRRRDLHGNAGARAGARRRSSRRARRLVKPGGWVFFLHAEPQCEVVPVRGDRRGIHRADAARKARTTTRASSVRRNWRVSYAHAELRTVDIKGIVYNPLSKHFTLSDDTSVNYMLACRRDV
jgi:2-polyprenyl-6-hydroxyphenyl methylase/3-demethylubiquinone-9 3-methyltransferase